MPYLSPDIVLSQHKHKVPKEPIKAKQKKGKLQPKRISHCVAPFLSKKTPKFCAPMQL